MTKVVNLKDEPYDIYIGRAGKGENGYFGNPFYLGGYKNRDAILNKYKNYFLNRIYTDKIFREKILNLKGKILGCFCKPEKCHGDIIVEWLEGNE